MRRGPAAARADAWRRAPAEAVCALPVAVLAALAIAVGADVINSNDVVFLRAQCGTRLTLENGEIHAFLSHQGVWQSLTIVADKPGAILPGTMVHLRTYSGDWLVVRQDRVEVQGALQPEDQGLQINRPGPDPIRSGDQVSFGAPGGGYLTVSDGKVFVQALRNPRLQEFTLETGRPRALDGRWTRKDAPGREVFVIKGDTISFVSGIETAVTSEGASGLTTNLKGNFAHSSAWLNSAGELSWNNGDVWIRAPGEFDGTWTCTATPGEEAFLIFNDTIHRPDGSTVRITPTGSDSFAAGTEVAHRAGANLRWSDGTVWEPMPSGEFDGVWTDREDPGQDFFYIRGKLIFFDEGLESMLTTQGNGSFTAMPTGLGTPSHGVARLDDGALYWDNGDVWVEVPTTTTTTTTSTSSTWTTSTTTTQTATWTQTETETTTATTTSTTTETETVTTTVGYCFEADVSYAPLNMDGTIETTEASPQACQMRCRGVESCAHWTFWPVGPSTGQCHLQDMTALRTQALGYIAGPMRCFANQPPEASHYLRVQDDLMGNNTFLPVDLACMEIGTRYDPTSVAAIVDGDDSQAAALACQRLCADTAECAHFTLSFPEKACSLASAGATQTRGVMNYLAGPPSCEAETEEASASEHLSSVSIRRFLDGPAKGGPSTLAGLPGPTREAVVVRLACAMVGAGLSMMVLMHLYRTGRCVQLWWCCNPDSVPESMIHDSISRGGIARQALILPARALFNSRSMSGDALYASIELAQAQTSSHANEDEPGDMDGEEYQPLD